MDALNSPMNEERGQALLASAQLKDKLVFIEENIYMPRVGDYADAEDNESDYRIADLGYDDHYLVPDTCVLIHRDHYDRFQQFLKTLPDEQQFADSQTRPYLRDDRVVGPALTTRIFFVDPFTGETELVGYDDFPVICLETNGDCYVEDCENWTVDLLEAEQLEGDVK